MFGIKKLLGLPFRIILEGKYAFADFQSTGLLLLYMAKDEMDRRWAQSILGRLWFLLYPLLFLGMYATVHFSVLNIRMGQISQLDFTLLIFCGLVPYFCLAESLNAGTSSLNSNRGLFDSIKIPVELIPARSVLVAFLGMAFSITLLIAGLGFIGKLTAYTLLVIPAVLLQLVFTLGLVWFLSVMAVFVREVGNIVQIFVLMMLFTSPFAYTSDMVPEHLKFMLHFNPMYYMVELYREPMFYGRLPDVNLYLIFGGLSIFLFLSGHYFIRNLKSSVVDYV